ncbi:glycosyltransferase family 4 protein [Planococcus lenghuensis]|uniref:Glycosyltransferase family 1 protein n=1 Tax=Planococcus lenghuensis TaxID=2213202 RepID=A0A1Q2L195_9BACL|nr:glycosyltransferase family 4 protein [Planococcus lenghuensis]AQQ54228.1 hypothetical protein B0X71_14735 [Planococcus lenghuensis]
MGKGEIIGSKIIHGVTVPRSLDLMDGQLRYLKEKGFDVKALCSPGDHAEFYRASEQVDILKIEMEREISPFKDSLSLYHAIQLLHQEKPAIVNAGTPKAGLILTMAAKICGVPIRIYTVRGLRLETTEGVKRLLLLNAERTAAKAATHVIAVSESIKNQLIDLDIAEERKIHVLGRGSSNGFAISKFERTEQSRVWAEEKRREIGLSKDNLVLGYVGRMTKDKGVDELVSIFVQLRQEVPKLKLLLIGDFEEADSVEETTKDIIQNHRDIIHFDYQPEPVPYFHLMDVFVLLSKREGFSNVLIEATLSGVPPVAAAVTGTTDTIIDGKTGYLTKAGDLEDVKAKVRRLLMDSDQRQQFAVQGKVWAEENFSNGAVWSAMYDFYQTTLQRIELQPDEQYAHNAVRFGRQR